MVQWAILQRPAVGHGVLVSGFFVTFHAVQLVAGWCSENHI